MLYTSPSAPVQAQKTYRKVLKERAKPTPRAVTSPSAPAQAQRVLQEDVARPKPTVFEQFTQVAPVPSDPVSGYMTEQGWTMPVPDEPPPVLDEVYQNNPLTDLQPYEYTISPEQEGILKEVFEGAPGVEIPRAQVKVSEFAGNPRKMAMPSGCG